ncbi:MAG: hypothetical protein AB8I08_01675 [Sandaracinaceae bacterium]
MRWMVLSLLLVACGQDATTPEPEPAAPARVPWPAVQTTDGITELRAFENDRVLLLRRVDEDGWVRGWAGPADRYRRQSGEIVYAGFWMHAASLRGQLEDGEPVSVAEVNVSPALMETFLEDVGVGVDATLFESEEHEGRYDYVIRETFTGPGVEDGFRCDASLLIRPRTPPAGLLTVEQLQVEGANRAPIDAPIQMWLEDAEGEQTRLVRGEVPLEQLGALAENEGLQLCSVDCCIQTSEEDRAQLQASVTRGTALSAQIAARPTPDPLRRGTLPPLP